MQAEELEESLSSRLQQLPPPLARGSTGRVSESSDGASLQGDSSHALTSVTNAQADQVPCALLPALVLSACACRGPSSILLACCSLPDCCLVRLRPPLHP